MLRTVMVRHGRSVAGIPRFRDSMLPITAASIATWFDYFTREEEEEGGGERTIERGPQPSILTENSEQTSGRLDETAERHETEGKRKWQGLSEGASTPFPPPLSIPLSSQPAPRSQVVPRADAPPINYAAGLAAGLHYRLRSTFTVCAICESAALQ